MFITEIDPTLLAVLGGVVMGALQGTKAFIDHRYQILALGLFSASIGLLYTVQTAPIGAGIAYMSLQTLIYSYLVAAAAAGPYSIVKAVKKENPAGL